MMKGFLLNPLEAQAVMLKAAITMSRESQDLMVETVKRAGQRSSSPISWVSFEMPVLDPRSFFSEDVMRAAFHRMADRNLRGWEVAADMLKVMPDWVGASSKMPGTVLTDWFDQMRRAGVSMMPANDAWATGEALSSVAGRRPAAPASAKTGASAKARSAGKAETGAADPVQSAPARRASAEAATPAAKPARRAPSKPATPRPDGPLRLDKPRGKADDLMAIKGIGEKLASLLNTLGIYHYDQMAAWTEADGEWIDKKLAFKGRVAREKWVEQAKALVKKAA